MGLSIGLGPSALFWLCSAFDTVDHEILVKRLQLSFGLSRNGNRKLQTSKAPLKSQAQGTSLFTSAASNQRGFPKNSQWEAQVRLPEGERMRQIRGVFQRIVRGKLKPGCQKVRGGRLGVKAGVV